MDSKKAIRAMMRALIGHLPKTFLQTLEFSFTQLYLKALLMTVQAKVQTERVKWIVRL